MSKALYYLCMEIVQLRRPFCPLCHATKQQEVGMLTPRHPEAGSWSSSYSIPAGLQWQVREKSAPHPCAERQPTEKRDKNQPNNLSQHCPGIPMTLGCRERLSGQSPHEPCHCPGMATPIPTTAWGLPAGPEQEKTMTPSSKTLWHFFLLTLPVIY